MSNKKYINELKEKGYTILNEGEIKTNSSIGVFKCEKCGMVFERMVKSARKSNPYCKECCYKVAGEKLSKTKTPLEKWTAFFEEKDFKDYFFVEGKCYIKCSKCGAIQQKVYNSITKQKHYNLCGNCARAEYESSIDSVKVLNEKLIEKNWGIICIEEREHFDNKTRVKFKCKCGRTFIRKPNTVLQGKYLCPHCASGRSYNERTIADLLDDRYEYNMEYIFQDCKNIRPLPFDFYIGELNTCIEYDGEYHYKNIAGRVDLEKRKLLDKIKNDYCINNYIFLIRIKYTSVDYEEKLLKCLENISQGNLEPTIIEIE